MSAKARARHTSPSADELTERLKREIARYGEILDSVRAIVWRAEAATFRTTFASKQAEEILGFSPERWANDPGLWVRQLHPDDVDWVLDYSRRMVEQKQKHSFEYRIRTVDGRTVWLRNIVNVIVENGRAKELVGISVDINERKLAEEARAEVTRRLLRAQEEERSLIARELHDDIAQSLAVLNMRLHQLERKAQRSPRQRAAVADARGLALKIANDVERLSRGLHPSQLEQLGLAAAVRDWCGDFARHSGFRMECRLGDIPRDLDLDVTGCLFRILQECLRNIAKHSQAGHVSVELSAGSGQVRLQVSDDGIGFDPASATPGLGFVSMRERLRLVGGKLELTSAPGKGTRVEATVRHAPASLARGV